MAELDYQPVPFDVEAELAKALEDSDFQTVYEALQNEFAALDVLLRARKEAGLTQAEVAERMGIKQSALARIESSLTDKKHSPTLATLRKYAAACGKRLEISLR